MSNFANCQNVCMHIWSNATFPQCMHTPYTQKPTNFTKEIPWYLFHFPKCRQPFCRDCLHIPTCLMYKIQLMTHCQKGTYNWSKNSGYIP